MPLLINLRHLEKRDLTLKGELPVADLDIDTRDACADDWWTVYAWEHPYFYSFLELQFIQRGPGWRVFDRTRAVLFRFCDVRFLQAAAVWLAQRMLRQL